MVITEEDSLQMAKYDLKRMRESGFCKDFELEIIRQAEEIVKKLEPTASGATFKNDLWSELRVLTEYLEVKSYLKSIRDDGIFGELELQEIVQHAEVSFKMMKSYVFPLGVVRAEMLFDEYRSLRFYLQDRVYIKNNPSFSKKTCKKCHFKNKNTATYCINCGEKFPVPPSRTPRNSKTAWIVFIIIVIVCAVLKILLAL